MDENLEARLNAQDEKLGAILAATEKSRNYLRTMVIINIAMLILPAVGFLFLAPLVLGGASALMGI